MGAGHYFIELLYAMLAAWGMDQGGAKLVDFGEFRAAVLYLVKSSAFGHFEGKRVKEVRENWMVPLLRLWGVLCGKARIMRSRRILVGSSKLLHHLLPHVFPPMDGTYTLPCLSSLDPDDSTLKNLRIPTSQDPDFRDFLKVILIFGKVARAIPRIERYLGLGPESGSVPKIIDNAIMTWWATD